MNKILYDHTWMKLREDANGEAYVQMQDEAVMIVALNDNHEVLFIEEKSIAYQMPRLTLPTGAVELSETLSMTANRELQEEVGYATLSLRYLGTLHPSIKYMHWQCHIFLARKLLSSVAPGDEISPIHIIPIRLVDIPQFIASHQLSDSTSIAALYLAQCHLEQEELPMPDQAVGRS